jgi:hypothetical protein
VIGEEIAMMGEVMGELSRSYPGYPLADLDIPHCILGIDAFERAVEVSACTGKRLSYLLDEYVAKITQEHTHSALADEFGGATELVDTFAATFIRTGE